MKRKISIYTVDGGCHEYLRCLTAAEVLALRRQFSISSVLELKLNGEEHWELFNRAHVIKMVVQPSEENHGPE